MSNDFSSAIISGRLVEDPAMISTATGASMCKFTVAVNKWMGKEKKERTAYIPVTVFGKEASLCGEYLSSGRGVRVQGELETRSYQDKEKVKRKAFSVVVSEHNGGRVTFLTGNKKTQDDSTPETTSTSTPSSENIKSKEAALSSYLNKSRD